MGIKDLFNENSTGVVPTTSIEEEVVRNTPELESVESIREQRERIERYIPPLDFSDPKSFARYGSAESYYQDAISRIYNQYPYDGSEREIQEFLNESNYVDLHIYEDQYPRTTGYAIFSADGWGTTTKTDGWGLPSSLEYISIKGGPHTSSGGIPTGELRKAFGEPTNRTNPNANIYDNDIYGTAEVETLDRVGSRESNLQYKLSNGTSVEFWLKKDAWISSLTEKETIFDLWNGEASSSAGYGRFLLYLTASTDGTAPMRLHFASGSNVVDATVLSTAQTTASVGDGNWHHYAVALQSNAAGSNVEVKSYVDGALDNAATTTVNFGEVTGSLIGRIAALQTTPSGNAYHGVTMAGSAKLSGSLDEFRFWKSKRTERDISRNWWTQVRGGTNTDISNADLGFYFKFNEGITGDATNDATVLDYSGRISNGVWTGYPSSNARNVGSAINSSTATITGTTEFKDPIIYSDHADVVSLYNTYSDSGSVHDHANVSSILDSLPSWIVEEDDAKGSGELKKLAQIVGSYFDTLHLQVEHLPKIAEVGYQTASAKPLPFSERLLSSFGLHAPETFVEASILEKFANRRDDREYSLDINDVKNQVYQNIYNNLNFIYKSKGTEKSFRNLIRCYGIDEEVIKLNAYGNNSTFKFEDTYSDATVRKNYIDFNHTDRFDGIVYQNSSSNSETVGITYISGTNVSFANTAEVEVMFPKKMEISNEQYFVTPFVSCSLFGAHAASASAEDFAWHLAPVDYGFQIYFIKTAEESKDGKFLLTTRTGDFTLTSSVYADVYDNQKWNLSVRTKDAKYPYAAGVSGSSISDDIRIEFSGYNIELGVIRNSFHLTSSGLADEYLSSNRRYYAGADRTDTVGAVVTKTDVRVSSARHYAHYLEDSTLLTHAKDPTNFGVGRANKNIIFSANDAGIGIDNIDLPEYASLAMHWDFSQVTTSDAAGAFEVDDSSSGSVSLQTRYSADGNFSHIVANQYAGRGYFPSALSSTSIVDKNYVPASVQRLPEVVNSNDAVNVLTQDDDLYPNDPAVSQTFFAFEKSMFGVISQEMINTMATIIEFNNLVGEMTNKYRGDYKDFTRLRTLFFEKIENNPDLDKFIDYYKWIDNSLSVMIQQLVPASADVADEIRTIVESHIFERSKYRHKMPLLDYKGNARWGGDELLLEARAFGINELAYDWKHGHAPIATQATATIAMAKGDDPSGISEKEVMTIVSTDGTTRNYVVIDDNATTVATAAALTTTSDTGANQAGTKATATFIGTAALNGADGTNIILTNADGSTVTFHTDPTKNFGDTSADGGDHIWTVNTRDISGGSEVRKATQAFHIACLTAIAAGELDMTADPATDTGTQTSFTLTQNTAGTAGNTAITLVTGMTADASTFTGGAEVAANSVAVAINLTGGSLATQNAFLVQLKAAIESENGHNGKILVSAVPTESGGTDTITLTQSQRGFAGNTAATTTGTGLSDNISQTTLTQFTGGDDKQSTSALWWKERSERNIQGFDLDASIDSARQTISDVILSFNSASYKGKFSTAAGTNYDGSTYALRRFASPAKLTVGIDKEIRSGYNFPRTQKPESITRIIKPGSTANLQVTTGDFKDINVEETGAPILTVKRPFITETSENSKIHSPVGQFSSSLGTTEFAGLHTDAYGDHYETPMQGPFTQEHVGGYQHRHVPLNNGYTYNDGTLRYSLDASDGRPEAWDVHGGNTFTTRSSMHHPPAYSSYQRDGKAKRPVNIKNIQSQTASLVHISEYGGGILGNYQNIYEVVQTSGRRENNSEFVKNEGFGSSSTVSPFLEDANDYAKPTRAKRAHVFVNRFSAPGGPETAGDANGGPFLDLESAEYSPYNEMNSRNLTVRKPLQTLLTEHNEQFGFRSGSSTIGAIYKTNKNRLQRIEKTGGTGLFVTTASVFDNYYVQHVIPQSDEQYTWITASHLSSETVAFGYFPADGMVSTSAGLVAASSFVSASEVGTGFASGIRRTFKKTGVYTAGTFVPTDYAGINTTIIEPISGSSMTLGYPPQSDTAHYYNYSDIGDFATNTENQNSFVEKIGSTAAATSAKTDALNAILSHRQGPYGHPTWKQIRVGQGALGRHYRKNSLYTHTPFGGDELKTNFANAVQTIPTRRGETLIISQSAITSKYHPIKQELLVVTGEGRGKSLIRPMMIMSSYANNVVYFDDPDFANKVGIKIKKGFSAYNQVKNLYLADALENPSSPVVGVNRVIYTETVWPSLSNAHTSKVRGRTDFTNNFWRDKRIDRTTLAATKKPTNTAGTAIAQSAWALDTFEDFLNLSGDIATGGTSSAAQAGHRSGELLNEYVHYHAGDATKAYAGALYARKHLYPATSSIAPIWGFNFPDDEIIGELRLKGPNAAEILPRSNLGRADALWEAGNNAGAYEGTSSIFVKTPVNPFYDSYDDYFADIKSKGKDYSIIPEFRVTEHLEFYRNQGYNYLSENQKMFSIANVPSGTTVPQNSSEDNFFKVFTNSDFMKHFAVVRQDHEGILEPHVLRLKCKAIKKFVPYDGFYPAERTTELVRQFMDSYGSHVSFVTGSDTGLATIEQYTRNFIKPLFAPGILYNTIKSGLAVDYPIMNGDFNRKIEIDITDDPLADTTSPSTIAIVDQIKQKMTSGSFAIHSNSKKLSSGINHATQGGIHNDGWDQRVPFEALLEPEKYLAGVNINDDEPSDLARVDATVTWSGEGDSIYRYMAHNFFAETANFFLKGGKTTGISSISEENFKEVTPGQIYGMRIKLWRSMDKGKVASGSWGQYQVPQNTREVSTTALYDGKLFDLYGLPTISNTDYTAKETFTMYSTPSAFGPALGLQTSETSSFSGSLHDFGARNGIYGSHTPPYYDGESWVDLIFFPSGLESFQKLGSGSFNFRSETNDLSPYRPTLGEIFATPNEAALGSDSTGVPINGTFMRKWRYDEQELRRDSTSTYGRTGATYGPAAGPWMNEWAMQGDASLNIFDRTSDSDGDKWRIQTKFETPMLNFNDVSVANDTLTITDISGANATIPRGMWHQFGRLPLEGEGVYMQVTDIPANWLATHPSATLKWDMAGQYATANKSPRVSDYAGVAEHYSGYSIPVGSTADAGDGTNPPISSLIDVCGFNTDPVRIGEVSDNTSIREAIVAVPFIVEEGERKFFTMISPDSAQFNSMAGRTIVDQVEAMERYVFPPTLDFVKNKSIDPFAMYIFEFEHKFDKNDLSHMWQNLSPKIGTVAEESTSVIAHNLLANELMGDWKTLMNMAQSGASFDIEEMFTPMNDKVQWMVFKVKQKAKTNYYEALAGKEAEAEASTVPDYTHNWPYDFCSIVELAKLDSEVQLGGKVEGLGKAELRSEVEEIIASGGTGGLAATAAQSTGTGGITAALYSGTPAGGDLDPDAVDGYSASGTSSTDDDDDSGSTGPLPGGGTGPSGGDGANPGDGAN